MEYKIKKMGIPVTLYEFFDATDGHDEQYDTLYETIKFQINSRGAMGISLTYIRLLEDAHNNKYESVLIFEDDISPHINLHNFSFDKTIKQTYDIIWLGANQPSMSITQKKSIDYGSYLPEPQNQFYTYGAYSILLTQNCISKLVKLINHNTISYLKPIDNVFNDLIMTQQITGIVIYPFWFVPDVTESDNMIRRDQNEFADVRGIDMKDFEYVSQRDINSLRDFVNTTLTSIKGITCLEILHNIKDSINNNNNIQNTNRRMYVSLNMKQVFLRITKCITNYNDIINIL